VGGGRQARENALLTKEEGTGADGEDSTFAGRITLLKLRKVGNEREGLEFLGDDLLGVTTNDDEDVKILKALVCLLVGDLGADDDTLVRDDLGLWANDGNLEGLVIYIRGKVISGRGKDEGNTVLRTKSGSTAQYCISKKSLTVRVLEVVASGSKDLKRAGKVQKIELFVDSEENVNGLLVSDG
jgi:hypothetical protein